MFQHVTENRKFFQRTYTVKGTLHETPVILTIQGVNAMDAVAKAQETNPGLLVISVHVGKDME